MPIQLMQRINNKQEDLDLKRNKSLKVTLYHWHNKINKHWSLMMEWNYLKVLQLYEMNNWGRKTKINKSMIKKKAKYQWKRINLNNRSLLKQKDLPLIIILHRNNNQLNSLHSNHRLKVINKLRALNSKKLNHRTNKNNNQVKKN